ncbi:metal-dependent hydrolase family protein [Kangiella koreensis]|uniref:Amidohydrolase n=1 Tax=Kangiella koreensis (strain DSM 16069 / JCM 12317 / KCTC 12182 / SW-125) TaxID=523791 RepID=C7R857_KANKD|nr:amidohydrolase family protein [Kangiella koreensis]ACV25839.1 amidohydrolase [Kangiella koreensis DSM 16069]
MTKTTLAIAALIASTAMSPSSANDETANTKWLHCGNLIDTQAGKVLGEHFIQITGNKVSEVTTNKPSTNSFIDLSNKTCLPGLMDMHVHLDGEMSPTAYVEGFTLNPADLAFRAQEYGMRTLLAGFTTVRNPGDSYNVTISLRNAINQGWVDGPRIYSAGKSLASTGGHADPTNGVNAKLMGDPGPKQGVVNSVEDAKKAVRQRYKEGADFIKVTATGGVLSLAKSGQNPQFTVEELKSIIDTAKDYGMHVAAHAHGKEGMLRAIEAGITSIEHGTYMDKEVMRAMKKNGTYYVPTVIAGKFVAEKAEIDGFFPEIVRPKARAVGPLIQNTFGEAYDYGVKIAFGTDSGVSAHGDNAKEFEYMVEAGMPAMAAIQSATVTSAELLDNDQIGVIAKGKLADIIAVDGNPAEDIKLLQNVSFVMKDGTIYKQ